MVLLWGTTRRDTVSLLSFPFSSLRPRILEWGVSCYSFKRSVQLFFFLLIFSGYFHSADPHVVSIASGGYNQSSTALIYVVFQSCIDALMLPSMLASSHPPSFLDTYSLPTSSLGCNVLCTVISFLVLWSIFLSSSLVYFKNGPEYLTRRTGQVFISLTRFLSFVSSSYLVILRYF